MSLTTITGGGSFTRQNITDLNSNFLSLAQQLAGTTGNIIYCWPSSGFLGTQTGSSTAPYSSIVDAYNAGSSGKNDVIVLVGNGAASGSARISATLTWAKDALHLIGIDSGVNISCRARIAPVAATTAFANFFVVSGNGCLFSNIQWFHGFDTGTTAAICMTVTGSRNRFESCHIAGMGDTASAQSSTSRSLKIGLAGSGENMFVDCTIGLDTVTRTVANATVEFTAATTRNQFVHCTFPIFTTSATTLGFIGSASGCMDRTQTFDNCMFDNAIGSGSTTLSGLGTLAASAGGQILFKQSVLLGITEYGTDVTTRNQCWVAGLTGAAATDGIAVNPS